MHEEGDEEGDNMEEENQSPGAGSNEATTRFGNDSTESIGQPGHRYGEVMSERSHHISGSEGRI